MTEVVEIILMVIPWIAAIVLLIWSFYLKYKRLPQTVTEWKEALSNVVNVRDQIVKFFNAESPMSETSIEVIKEYIPANSYQMSDESQATVLSYCKDEEEKTRVLTEIYNWENPTKTGEECCVYTLETSGATFKVQYGVPELIELKTPEVKYLTQTQCFEISKLLKEDDVFKTMWLIMKNQIEGLDEYELSDGVTKVLVKNGEYSVYKSE